jgi:catechol 2,3-dioxygenase-like lactoylglutathione lyase family enzyme
VESTETVVFVGAADLDRARDFYAGCLALEPVERTPIADVYRSAGTVVRVTLVDEVHAAPYTLLGWTVVDIDRTVRELSAAGVVFEHFAGMDQDDLGIWIAPGGARVAWFRDPDDNLLSLSWSP